jgi:hypothetical protein
MAEFKALAQGVEVNGQTVLTVVDGMNVMRTQAYEILKKHGINNPQPKSWYPQQAWLDAFKEIAQRVGRSTLFQIGTKIPDNADFPSNIDTLDKALAAIDIAYHFNHRGGEIGHYQYIKTGEYTAKMFCNNPYPCEFDRGIISAMAQRFKPADVAITIIHDETSPCRKKGAEDCTYLISFIKAR